MKLKMFKRTNGTFGVRNRIAVIPTVACVNHVAEKIAAAVDIADAYTHPYGCDQLGADLTLSFECLRLMGTHPNTGAVLVVGLGCEKFTVPMLLDEADITPENVIILQEQEGFDAMIDALMKMADKKLAILNERKRETLPLSKLCIGMQCGGSDAFSGVTANPSAGYAADMLVKGGATVKGKKGTNRP